MKDRSTLAGLQRIYRFVLGSRRSDFYRAKYVSQNLPKTIKTFNDWQKIPFLTRKDLLEAPPYERLFLPEEKIVSVEPSSGTTDKPLVIFAASYSKEQTRLHEGYLKQAGVRRLLVLLPPFQAYHYTRFFPSKKFFLCIGDIANLSLSAQIAEQVKVQGIRSTPTLLSHFLPYLTKHYDLAQLKYVNLGGEFCTLQKAKILKEQLPGAKIYFRYGGTETMNRAYQCDFLATKNPQYFHPYPSFYFEMIDPQTGRDVAEGKEGEIVLTTLAMVHPTPLLRYRTGDLGILRKKRCPCGESYLLEVRGRANFDSLKISGLLIQAQKTQDAISKVSRFVEDDFQLHVYEKKQGSKLVVFLELELVLKKDRLQTLSFLEQEISKNLYFAPNLTLNDLVQKGFFLPLKIKPVTAFGSKVGEKKKYIIPHLIS